MDWVALLDRFAPLVAGVLTLSMSFLSAAHAVLHKRDVRAAIAWVGLCLLAPVAGPILYLLLGLNRIRRRARRLRTHPGYDELPAVPRGARPDLARFLNRVTRRALLEGNRVTILDGGDEAFPAMLAAIESAERSISLTTYIFDPDSTGLEFVAALARARARGVEVRVLVDAVGARYAFPRSILGHLRKAGLPHARFLPTVWPWRLIFSNLRNHKKGLVVDGRVGFLGGMNLRDGHRLSLEPRHPVRDVHFQVEGPVVAQLQESFMEDWSFTTDELLEGEAWFPPLAPLEGGVARAITDGPDEDYEKLRWVFLAALGCARERVRVVTPYFLPDGPLISALNSAAMRGVSVEVLLPERGNLSLPEWACRAQLWQILERGCQVKLSPAPFDHSKLLTVDGDWALIGSGNWDPRSYRLCFELNLECHDPGFTAAVDALIDAREADARPLTKAELDARPLPVRFRDGVARLLAPFL